MRACEHRTSDQLNRWQAHRSCAHQLRRHCLVATTDQHNGIHGLGTQHFLRVHGHEVAQIHAGGLRKALMQGDGGEVHRQTTRHQDAPLHCLHQLRHVAMARVVGAPCVGNTNHGPIQGLVCVARPLDEGFAQKEREPTITVVGESFGDTARCSFRMNRGLLLWLVRHGRVNHG